jgi:GeoRSP system SPASM domain protein
MNLQELAFPIRVYWDLSPVQDNASVNYRSISEQIVEMKFFTLNLMDSGPQLSSSCIEILERLKNESIAVSLTLSQLALNTSTVEHTSDLKVSELLVNATTDDDLLFIADSVRQFKDKKMTIGASFQVMEDNYRNIPDILSFCLDNNINRLVFPMQRITGKGECFYIRKEEGQVLSQKISEMDMDDMKITIHDPFLWRIFYPHISFPGGGCQAANSMAYIGSDGKVYPCPTMPIELGDLKESSLKSILSSDYKKELVRSIRNAPEECLECGELSGCKGGCTGRVYALTGSLNQRDPACT